MLCYGRELKIKYYYRISESPYLMITHYDRPKTAWLANAGTTKANYVDDMTGALMHTDDEPLRVKQKTINMVTGNAKEFES
ncbi:unnamed protein product [Toxocara canis]|uniref:Major capsid protein n=1 Tax=Toxocara canis TaxID=6265 RepID=A0A183UPY9_TOXCA|nr:unnamed protein product [Toxocara canis]